MEPGWGSARTGAPSQESDSGQCLELRGDERDDHPAPHRLLYGILHAVGPGHGKTIISSYVVANEETVRRGVIISFIAAGLQALTAVALVGLLLFGLNATGLQINAWSNRLESLSYAMIAIVGLYS